MNSLWEVIAAIFIGNFTMVRAMAVPSQKSPDKRTKASLVVLFT